MENIENNDVLKAEIKSILAFKAKDGATYKDVKDEYAYLMGKTLCFESAKHFKNFMRTLPDVYKVKGADGRVRWFSNSVKSKHIAQLVQNQKTPREPAVRQSPPLRRRLFYNSTSTCYYNDNYLYKNRRFTKSESSLNKVKRSRNAAFFYDYELVGDDFFLNIAHLDCKQKLDYITSARGYRGRPIKKCGQCISGQSISNVTDMVKSNVKFNDYLILNIGSVDLLQGRNFIEMRNDFVELYSELENRGIHTVVTTLAPLANMLFSKDIQKTWQQFNSYLTANYSNVIDIACCFVSNTDRVLFECYQPVPKYVTGSSHAHLLWNFIGRQRLLKHLRDSLAEITYSNSILNF